MLKNIKAFCITLDPKNPERAQRAIKEIKFLGFQSSQFFLGVNGRKLSDKVLRELLTPRAYYELKKGRYVHEALSGPGSVGCYLSHIGLWKKCIELNEPIAIFEDDFVAKKECKEKMENALNEVSKKAKLDVLRFQHRNNPDYGEELKEIGLDCVLQIVHTEGLCAYVISPHAAQVLLEKAFPIDAQVDHYLDMRCFETNLFNLSSREDLFDDPQVKSWINHNSILMYNDTLNNSTFQRHRMCIFLSVICFIILLILVLTYKNEILI